MASHAIDPEETPAEGIDTRARGTAPIVVPIRPSGDGADPLASFSPEAASRPVDHRREASPPATAAKPKTPNYSLTGTVVTIVVAAAIVTGAGFGLARYGSVLLSTPTPAAAKTPSGRVTLNSRPAGAAVTIDGAAKGVTPLELELAAGAHEVVFTSETGERRLALNVEANVRTAENIDMPAPGATGGEIEVTSSPTDARVTVDGTIAGRTPLKVRSIAAGRHVIEVAQGSSTVTRTVDLAAGGSLNVFLSLAGSSAASGTFAVDSPVELRLLENGQLLGLSGSAPLTLSAGRHQLDMVNESLEISTSRTVTVEAGKTTRINVAAPNGTMFANALPWAEVFVDGRSIGVTPLGNVPVAAGTHEVVWRHPQFGEKRRTVAVGARTPVRLSMDMSK